jgi:uncharacterized protein YbaR (Trm112 family)
MISGELLCILRCPETHQPLQWLDAKSVEFINQKVSGGAVQNVGGSNVHVQIDGGLVREDGRLFYPVRGDIPLLLIGEAILL